MMINSFKSILLSASFFSLAGCAAQKKPAPASIYMYMNDYAYIICQGDVNTPGGTFVLREKEIPKAVSGTFWFNSKKGITQASVRFDTLFKQRQSADILDVLKANKSKKVKLTLNYPGQSQVVYSGVVESVYADTTAVGGQMRLLNGNVILATESGNIALFGQMLNYCSVEFDKDVKLTFPFRTVEKGLHVYFKGSPEKADLTMSWLQTGPTWKPSARLQLTGESSARFYLSAEISSPGFDLEKCGINLVVAKPDVINGSKLSLLSRIAEFENITEDDNLANGYKSQSPATRVSWNFGDGNVVDDASVENAKAMDYYIYRLKNLNLNAGGAAQVTVLEGNIPIEHVYQCSFPAVNEYTGVTVEDPMNPTVYEVYHRIKMTNVFNQPLAACPVVVEAQDNGSQIFSAQVSMPEIPAGEHKFITISRSMDLPVTMAEEEVSRVKSAVTIPGKYTGAVSSVYDKVKVKATIRLSNKGKNTVTLNLFRQFSGLPLSSDLPWTLKKKVPKAGSPSELYDVDWKFDLKGGEEKIIVYYYEYLIKVN